MWRSHCIWGPSCCSSTSWHTSSFCRWGEDQWCTPQQTAGISPAFATSGHWLPPLRQSGGEEGGGYKCFSCYSVLRLNTLKSQESVQLNLLRFPLPFTVTLCSPVLGWVKISTWMDTSPTASSTPEPNGAETAGDSLVSLNLETGTPLTDTHKPLMLNSPPPAQHVTDRIHFQHWNGAACNAGDTKRTNHFFSPVDCM